MDMWVSITLTTMESGGSWNHVNDSDGSGFAIVTLTMEWRQPERAKLTSYPQIRVDLVKGSGGE